MTIEHSTSISPLCTESYCDTETSLQLQLLDFAILGRVLLFKRDGQMIAFRIDYQTFCFDCTGDRTEAKRNTVAYVTVVCDHDNVKGS